MPSSTQKAGLATAAAGVGLALGAAAIGAYVQTRKAKDRAPASPRGAASASTRSPAAP